MTASGSLRRFIRPDQRFPTRCKELLAIEGWYETPTRLPALTYYNDTQWEPLRFKISCRFNDILRASVFWGHSRHFSSCFAPAEDRTVAEVTARLENPYWGILYVPDRFGNFQARAWISWDGRFGLYWVDKLYGNADLGLINILLEANSIKCSFSHEDTYLVR